MLTARGQGKQRWKRPIRSFSPFPGEESQIIFHSAWSSLAFNYSSKGLSPLETFSRTYIFLHNPHLPGYIAKHESWIELTLQGWQKYSTLTIRPVWLRTCFLSLSVNIKIISLVLTSSVLSYSSSTLFSHHMPFLLSLNKIYVLAEQSPWNKISACL